MSVAASAFNNIVSTLDLNESLAVYVKHVYSGFRINMDPDSLPYICVEPTQNNEIHKNMNQYKDIFLNVDIISFSYCPTNSEQTVVGNANYRGILDIENDIRACLQSSNTLGDTVIDIQLDPTVFDMPDIQKKYFIRGMVIPAKILYRQNKGI